MDSKTSCRRRRRRDSEFGEMAVMTVLVMVGEIESESGDLEGPSLQHNGGNS